jgi:hypothetical protein
MNFKQLLNFFPEIVSAIDCNHSYWKTYYWSVETSLNKACKNRSSKRETL